MYLKNLGFSCEQSFWSAGLSLGYFANSLITKIYYGFVWMFHSSTCFLCHAVVVYFAANLKLLEHYPNIHIDYLLQVTWCLCLHFSRQRYLFDVIHNLEQNLSCSISCCSKTFSSEFIIFYQQRQLDWNYLQCFPSHFFFGSKWMKMLLIKKYTALNNSFDDFIWPRIPWSFLLVPS